MSAKEEKKGAGKATHFKVSRRVVLPINQDKVDPDFVPRAEVFEGNKSLVEQVAIAINKRMPVLLIGETGTGKTSLVRYLASVTNNGFRRVNHNGGTTVEDIKGQILINGPQGTYWVDGVLIDAMRLGHWYLADEINASGAEINFVYHSLLDDDHFVVLNENNREVVRPHPNFRFFGSMNPASDYVGTKELNRALMSRFVVSKTDFADPRVEAKILTSRTNIPEEVADAMISFAVEIRATKAKDKIAFTLSTRDLLMWAEMFQSYGTFIPSAETTLLNKVTTDDFDMVKDLLALHFKKVDDDIKAGSKADTVLRKVEKQDKKGKEGDSPAKEDLPW